nr:hypothetical protein [Candidatus Delongbacteria bacterium]
VKNPDSLYTPDHKLNRYYIRNYNQNDEEKLIREKNREYTSCKQTLQHAGYDMVLILNGLFNVETDVCREYGINTFFFEHGYFPNTIQMDHEGVNSDASFANLSFTDFLNFTYPASGFNPNTKFIVQKINHNENIRALYRMLDPRYNRFLINFINKKRNQDIAKKRFQRDDSEQLDLENIGKYVFFPLQVNSDTQVILNSPFRSMYEVVEFILPELVKAGYKVIIKEHPMEVEPVDYSPFAYNNNVFLTKKTDLNTLIRNSEFVVNINSSVGLQSIAKHKKVLLLGSAFYKHNPSCFAVSDYKDIRKLLKDISSATVDKTSISAYIAHFKNHIFIQGHFYNTDINLLEAIRCRITGKT